RRDRDARGGEEGRRGGLVGGPVLGLREGGAGVQRGLAGLRPERPRAAAAHRLQPGARGPGGGTMNRTGFLQAAGAALAALCLSAAPARAQAIAITGGTVHPVSGAPIEHGTVLIRDGRIVAVGADVAIPADARRVDARGKVVTPGLIHASSNLGLLEVESIDATDETDVQGDVTPAFDVAAGLNPDNVRIPVARLEGVTSTIALPGGGFVAGQAAWIGLLGDRREDLLRRAGVATLANLGPAAKGAGAGARARGLARLERLLD